MKIEQIIYFALLGNFLVPLLSSVILALFLIIFRNIKEEIVAFIVRSAFLTYLFCSFIVAIFWMYSGFSPLKLDFGSLWQNSEAPVLLHFYIDKVSVLYLLIASIISNIVIFYSRRYLHRDPGYCRFFLVLFVFMFGMTLLICAGSFDLLFAGWELVGFSSFLLIGYYWHRPSAALNAKRTYFIYRACDLGLLISVLMSHVVWHGHHFLYQINTERFAASGLQLELLEQWVFASLILLAALGKSAQFPVSYWLPRAMEGPTPSSAIFYGSLSIHAGVFLLIRTFSIWHETPGFPWVVGSIGFISALFATLFGRVQANIKGQIGYASIGQVGLMLVELSFGLVDVALIHLFGNAFLRCFQLLVSPSILAQQLQIVSALEGRVIRRWDLVSQGFLKKWEETIYIFALNEGYFELMMKQIFVRPINWGARLSHRFFSTYGWLLLLGIFPFFYWTSWISVGLLFLAVFFSLLAFGEEHRAFRVLNWVVFSSISAVASLCFYYHGLPKGTFFYLIGLASSWFIAQDALNYMLKHRQINWLKYFSGFLAQFPKASSIFLLGILGILGFPIATTFWGQDVLLKQAFVFGQEYLAVFSLIYVLNGIVLMRLYCRIFWGARDREIAEVDFDYSALQTLLRIGVFLCVNWFAFYV